MATRIISPKPLVFDHAAQFFTVSDSRFRKLVDGWLEKGLIQEWKGLLVELEAGGHCVPVPYTTKRYVGTNGMRPLMDSIICQVRVRFFPFTLNYYLFVETSLYIGLC